IRTLPGLLRETQLPSRIYWELKNSITNGKWVPCRDSRRSVVTLEPENGCCSSGHVNDRLRVTSHCGGGGDCKSSCLSWFSSAHIISVNS
ncbi:unnamed protein product, partial [Ascophyllum nodosum]